MTALQWPAGLTLTIETLDGTIETCDDSTGIAIVAKPGDRLHDIISPDDAVFIGGAVLNPAHNKWLYLEKGGLLLEPASLSLTVESASSGAMDIIVQFPHSRPPKSEKVVRATISVMRHRYVGEESLD